MKTYKAGDIVYVDRAGKVLSFVVVSGMVEQGYIRVKTHSEKPQPNPVWLEIVNIAFTLDDVCDSLAGV